MKLVEIEPLQTVFMLFYAVFWGAIANVQPRWKAFQWPLFFKLPQARCRAVVAVVFLNLLPLCFFSYGMWALHGRGPTEVAPLAGSLCFVIRGVFPAFALFGMYRVWLGIIELHPDCFYASSPDAIDERYRHVEPTYRHNYLVKRCTPTVDLGADGWMNFVFGLLYVVIASFAPWCPLP